MCDIKRDCITLQRLCGERDSIASNTEYQQRSKPKQERKKAIQPKQNIMLMQQQMKHDNFYSPFCGDFLSTLCFSFAFECSKQTNQKAMHHCKCMHNLWCDSIQFVLIKSSVFPSHSPFEQMTKIMRENRIKRNSFSCSSVILKRQYTTHSARRYESNINNNKPRNIVSY